MWGVGKQYELEQRLPSFIDVLALPQGVVSIVIANKDNIDTIILRLLNPLTKYK